ncbi:MAG: carbon-nitrogen hydrolase family protein [Candidatus Poribacteria bacterium]
MNLLSNPVFETHNNIPNNWELFSPRDAIRPLIKVSGDEVTLSGNGSIGVFGTLKQTIKGIKGGEGYQFGVDIRADDKVEDVHDSVRVILQWKNDGGTVLQTDYCWKFSPSENWTRLEQVFKAHQSATCVDVHLVFRWSPNGSVTWHNPSLIETQAPKPRMITVSTISIGSYGDSHVIDEACKLYEIAGKRGSDLAVTTEFLTGFIESAEPIPGPTSDRLADIAKKYRMYIIASIIEKRDDLLYNTSFLLDRDGKLVGKYSKVHLTEGEIFAGITPGHEIPIFDCDFGKIGITICYDNKFSDIHRVMALKGAEIIVSSSEGDGREGGFIHNTVAEARAINNSVWVVAAGRSSQNIGQSGHWVSRGTFIISPEGYVLSDCGKMGPEVQTREIDLGRSLLGAVSLAGMETFSDVWREARRPHLYKPISTDTGRIKISDK